MSIRRSIESRRQGLFRTDRIHGQNTGLVPFRRTLTHHGTSQVRNLLRRRRFAAGYGAMLRVDLTELAWTAYRAAVSRHLGPAGSW
jgi:hypothetical protein